MSNTNVIYQCKWKGQNTKWEYLLEFIPADSTTLNNPTVLNLPSSIVIDLKYSYKYDKYPLGMPEAPTLNIELSLLEIPDTEDFLLFKQSVLNPAISYSWTFWFGNKFKTFEFVLGTIVNLKIRPTELSQFYTVFVGVIKSIDKINYDLNTKKVSFEATNLLKHVLESFNFSALEMFNEFKHQQGNQYIQTTGVIEFFSNQSNEVVEHYNVYHYPRMRPLSFLFDYITSIADVIVSKVTRGQIVSINFTSTLPIFNMYKQTYDKSGAKGSQIVDPFIIIQLVRWVDNEFITVDGICKAFEETYKNSVWDFIREYTEWMLSCGFLANNICFFSYLLGDDNFYIEVNQGMIKKIQIEINKNRVKTVTASTYEHFSGETYSDLTDYNAVKTGTLNEDEITIPMVFNNSPTAVEYRLFKTNETTIKQTFFPHIRNLYYTDQIWGSQDTFLRIHEFCEYYIKPNLLSSSFQSCSYSPFNYNQVPFKNIEKAFVVLQSTNCMHKWASHTLLEVFSQMQQSYLALTVPIEHISLWQPGQAWLFTSKLPWLIPLSNIKFDISTIDGNIFAIENWKVIEANVDFKTETAEMKLLSILI